MKFLTESVPLLLFGLAYYFEGLMTATLVLMIASIIAGVVQYFYFGKIAPQTCLVIGFVVVFGGLTLWLQDEAFIKIKPTLVNALFALVLFVGLIRNKLILKSVLSMALDLSDADWHILTRRFIYFFIAMAVLNELIWRTASTDFWVTFKIFGYLPLTLVFIFSQMPLLRRGLTTKAETTHNNK